MTEISIPTPDSLRNRTPQLVTRGEGITGASQVHNERNRTRRVVSGTIKETSKVGFWFITVFALLFFSHLAWTTNRIYREVRTHKLNAHDNRDHYCSVTIDPASHEPLDADLIAQRQASESCQNALHWTQHVNVYEETAARVFAEHLEHIPLMSWLYGGWLWNWASFFLLAISSSREAMAIAGTVLSTIVYQLYKYLDLTIFLDCCDAIQRRKREREIEGSLG